MDEGIQASRQVARSLAQRLLEGTEEVLTAAALDAAEGLSPRPELSIVAVLLEGRMATVWWAGECGAVLRRECSTVGHTRPHWIGVPEEGDLTRVAVARFLGPGTRRSDRLFDRIAWPTMPGDALILGTPDVVSSACRLEEGRTISAEELVNASQRIMKAGERSAVIVTLS